MNKGNAKPPGLYANMNKRRAAGTIILDVAENVGLLITITIQEN
jgi:hypothetical protein